MYFKKKKHSKLTVKLMVIAVLLFLFGFYILGMIENHYYEIKKSEVIKISKIYAKEVTKTSQTSQMINGLLEDKIEVASRISSLDSININTMDLDELSEKLDVDRIYYYNEQGRITNSTSGEYIDWKAYEGHPIYDFISSDAKMYIEEDGLSTLF